ncbi:MAG TPA: hypothetical protein VF087_14680 [Solirubrobacteraceae bacterium]
MAYDMTDDLARRLRASRPSTARPDEDAFDAGLLARVREQPIAARRTVPRAVAVPVAAGVTLTATAVVMLGGGPGDVGGPSSASAITQALHWLSPPHGTILHVRSVETQGSQTTTRELWESADHPASARMRTEGAHAFETAGSALYDPATDTIYDAPAKPPPGADDRKAGDEQKAGAPAGAPGTGKPGDEAMPAGDPLVDKVRFLLQEGQMVVKGREIHNGIDTWAISLKADVGRPVWTLWVSAEDGKPVELRDPGRDASEQPQVVRWPAYEVLPGSDADRLLTLTGAHPTARVVHDPAQVAAAEQRLLPPKP